MRWRQRGIVGCSASITSHVSAVLADEMLQLHKIIQISCKTGGSLFAFSLLSYDSVGNFSSDTYQDVTERNGTQLSNPLTLFSIEDAYSATG